MHNKLCTKGKSLGLIGRPLSHSFSKQYFEKKFKVLNLTGYRYDNIELDTLENLRDTVDRLGLDGFNVTHPYKMGILPLLDELDDTARRISAVNTVKVDRSGGIMTLTGYNTDAPAFLETLRPLLRPWHDKALILGTGGAARAVSWALNELGIDSLFVSRNPKKSNQISYRKAYELAPKKTIIINATPVGMGTLKDSSPWARPDLLTSNHLCYDLIYNPAQTCFLQEATFQGATTINGLNMLYRQADIAFDIWTNKENFCL
ncbi:MAG: shikimate dehydrogenase [Bacteroidales bacterium]|nr:shikimate dehydrogenase [Bacteroidales bacterium]